MKIVILDGYTMNPGDLSWDPMNALGEVTYYEKTDDHDIVSRLEDADIAVVNKVALTAEIIDQLPQLKMIAETATGFNNIDIQKAVEKGIVVSNVPAYSTESVVQTVFAHILNFSTAVQEHTESVANGDWQTSEHFCYWLKPIVEISGKTMGIVGFGNIGSSVARVASSFGLTVLVNSRTEKPSDVPVSFVDRETLLKESDFVVLTCALTPETENLINKESLALMKTGSFLVNTGRGPLVNEADLAEALKVGTIAGAGVDVLCQEPPAQGSPLIGIENCSITPHIAWASVEARSRLLTVTVQNIHGFIKGNPQNRVN